MIEGADWVVDPHGVGLDRAKRPAHQPSNLANIGETTHQSTAADCMKLHLRRSITTGSPCKPPDLGSLDAVLGESSAALRKLSGGLISIARLPRGSVGHKHALPATQALAHAADMMLTNPRRRDTTEMQLP